MARHPLHISSLAAAAVLATLGSSGASAADAVSSRSIAYVLTTFHWAVHATPEKSECPQGFNDGPREQYAALFPNDGTKRKMLDSELKREASVWFPDLEPDAFPFKEAGGAVAPGLNLDDQAGADDFTSPEGERGIDNQLYRALGCVEDYRPGGSLYHFNNFYTQNRNYTRVVVHLTDVDSLANDDDVTVTMHRGFDVLPTSASGQQFIPYGTQRIDSRWGGKSFTRRFRGRISNGVLTTAPADINIPYNYAFNDRGMIRIRDARLKINLTDEQAEGLWGGYIDVWSWYRAVNGALGTFSLSYGKQSSASVYKALNKLADAHLDPETGRNTAISGAIKVTFKHTFIEGEGIQTDAPRAVSENASPPDASGAAAKTQKALR